MIYTPREIINRRMHENAQNLGPQAKSPIAMIYRYASNRGSNGRRSGIKRPVFGRRRQARAARNPCFHGEFRDAAPIRTRAARGDINKSAEL